MKNLLKFAPILAALSLSLVLTACWPAQTYEKNGLSFKYPGGWGVTVDEFANSRGYLSLAKEESNPQATIIFGWLETDVPIGADMMLENIFEEMQITESFADFVAEPAEDTTYGDYPARAVTYAATIDGVPQTGAVWVFTAEGRVVNVAVREGASDNNESDFKKIKDSFKLK